MTTTIRVTTGARYNGLQVTLLGEFGAGLLAVAGYGTPQEVAIAAIAVKHHHGGERVYCVAGEDRWLASLEAVARAAVSAQTARDER